MKMNYDNLFYSQHRYRTSTNPDGTKSFNDTKWANIAERYQKLIELDSPLIHQQPYGVVGNAYGYDKLFDLLSRSNYTFQNIDQSLVDTYQIALKNAMTRNLVNTHVVVFHSKLNDRKNIVTDRLESNTYIVDIPYDQLHFGERDRFIRNKLHSMNTTDNRQYIHIQDFVQQDIAKILDCTFMCTINGKILNNWSIGINDKGLRFKVYWTGRTDVEIGICKFDECFVGKIKIPTSSIVKETDGIFLDDPAIRELIQKYRLNGQKCIIDLFSDTYLDDLVYPNFGSCTTFGIMMNQYQKNTSDTLQTYQLKEIEMILYVPKYLREVPNVFPAANFYSITDCRAVFDPDYRTIKDMEGSKIVSSTTYQSDYTQMTTPPIVIDREYDLSFDIISDCLRLKDNLLGYRNFMKDLLYSLQSDTYEKFMLNFGIVLRSSVYPKFQEYYEQYLLGANMSSVISEELVKKFRDFVDVLSNLRFIDEESFNDVTVRFSEKYYTDYFVPNEYKVLITNLTAPFEEGLFQNFANLLNLSTRNFYPNEIHSINRPVSEQSFMTLVYDRESNGWIFSYPIIKHFKGIENTFYIDSNLKGTEIFKFFIFYTENESPNESSHTFTEEQVLDFDEFCKEMEKQIGFIRYWYVENKLMKLSKMLYQKYDQNTVVQVLSQMLQGKIDGSDIVDYYPSDLNYEDSNVTTDGLDTYSTQTERAPFVINFLFYTLRMMNEDRDQFQSYFYRYLINRLYEKRYTDIDIRPLLKDQSTYPINYSVIHICPDIANTSVLSTEKTNLFCTIPMEIGTNGSVVGTPYRYTYHVYDAETHYPMLYDQNAYCVLSDDITVIDYSNDVKAAKLCSKYIGIVYDMLNEIQTNYQSTFNQTFYLESVKQDILTIQQQLQSLHGFMLEDTSNIVSSIVEDNIVLAYIETLKQDIQQLIQFTDEDNQYSLFQFVSEFTSKLKQVYSQCGFVDDANYSVKDLYVDLKQLQTRKMNPYELKDWVDEINLTLIQHLSEFVGMNTAYTGTRDFSSEAEKFVFMKNNIDTNAPILQTAIDNTSGIFTHTTAIAEYLYQIISEVCYNQYAIQSITFDTSGTYQKEPILLKVNMDADYCNPPYPTSTSTATPYILFKIQSGKNSSNQYTIENVYDMCEYAFFKGDSCTFNSVSVVYADGTEATVSKTLVLTFASVSSTLESYKDFQQLIPYKTTVLDFQNTYEKFSMNTDGMIVTEKHSPSNYELLSGNQFTILPHTSQKILDRKTKLQGSVDHIVIENQYLNDQIVNEYASFSEHGMYFKPVQVLHNALSSGVLPNVKGRYFENETVYLITDDELFIFPVKITAVDHAQNQGFIEAVVQDTAWKLLEDTSIEKYLTETVECSVLDDNLRSFYTSYNETGTHAFGYTINKENRGDPIYVQSHGGEVYDQINALYEMSIDSIHDWRFIYLGDGDISANDGIRIRMLKRTMDPLTLPEKYPVLREEPNDHEIWTEEKRVFKQNIDQTQKQIDLQAGVLNQLRKEYDEAETIAEQRRLLREINRCLSIIDRWNADIARYQSYIEQLEVPTTWFNVHSYDAALVYIENGRAKTEPTFVEHLTDIPYTGDVQIFLYDWETRTWLDPSSYTVTAQVVDGVQIDQHGDYKTNNVLVSIQITSSTIVSNHVLVYYAIDKSDVYDDITDSNQTCQVRFKPLLSSYHQSTEYDPYYIVNIRRHFSDSEKFMFTEYNPPEGCTLDCYHVIRPNKNEKHKQIPVMRICDLSLENNGNTYDYTDLDIYFRFPFQNVTSQEKYAYHTFSTTVNLNIDDCHNLQRVQLICVDDGHYNGNISDVVFDAVVSVSGTTQTVDIISTNLDPHTEGSFVCTVARDSRYASIGGLITVTVISNTTSILEGDWYRIPEQHQSYRELPHEFLVVPKDDITIDTSKNTYIILSNQYQTESDINMNSTNDADIHDPFAYYWDTQTKHRIPVSDVRRDTNLDRLVIDTTLNPNVSLIQSTYIGICRYSLSHIPDNGIIDVTGYIPTPLSKDRYEFWVNGRCIKDTDDVIITSPTSFQLCNLTSLRNFELIELVDDTDDSSVLSRGPIYVDLNGKMHSNYLSAFRSNVPILYQDFAFQFNVLQHTELQSHTRECIPNPNNIDSEEDILNQIDFGSVTNYELYGNLPCVNGVTLYHQHTNDLGIQEISTDDLMNLYDQVWKKEILDGTLFLTSHRKNHQDDYVRLRKQSGSNTIHITGTTDRYFALYLSNIEDGNINDTTNTVKIIPFVHVGMSITVDSSFTNKWVLCTFPNSNKAKI